MCKNQSGILMSNGKKLPMTTRPVKYCFKYLFAIFHNYISTKQAFPSFKLKFSDSNFLVSFFSVRH